MRALMRSWETLTDMDLWVCFVVGGGVIAALCFFFSREAISQAACPAVRSCRHIERCSHRDLRGTAIPPLRPIATASLAKTAIVSTARIASNRGF